LFLYNAFVKRRNPKIHFSQKALIVCLTGWAMLEMCYFAKGCWPSDGTKCMFLSLQKGIFTMHRMIDALSPGVFVSRFGYV